MEAEARRKDAAREGGNEQNLLVAQLKQAVQDVFAVEDVTYGLGSGPPQRTGQVLRLRGRLLMPAERAYEAIAPGFEALEHTALLRREEGRDVVYATPGIVQPTPSRRWVNVALFALTVFSVLFTGAATLGDPEAPFLEIVIDGLTHLERGLPAAVALLVPLLAHEFGHYLTARRLGLPATLPYFVPLPFPLSPLGTMGAIIRMKGPMRSRKTLLAVGAAGPLAGFIVALPFLVWGLARSSVGPFDPLTGLGIPPNGIFLEGNSLLYAGFKFLMFGQFLPGGGQDVSLDPVAFSAWAALLVTAINLIPAGQLDGGHIAYALLGEKARRLTWVTLIVISLMGFFWQGWWLWSLLIWFFGQQHAAPLDDITPLTARQRVLAVVTLIIFILTFIPVPMRLIVPPGV